MTLLALLQAVPALGAIGPQALPASGCAAYLWQTGPTPQLVAMAVAEPAQLRLVIDGVPMTLSRAAARGESRLGLPSSADFVGVGITAALELSVAMQPDLADGARVPSGTLTVARGAGDALVVPVAGLVGCARTAR